MIAIIYFSSINLDSIHVGIDENCITARVDRPPQAGELGAQIMSDTIGGWYMGDDIKDIDGAINSLLFVRLLAKNWDKYQDWNQDAILNLVEGMFQGLGLDEDFYIQAIAL